MRRKGIFTIFAAIFMVLAFSAVTFAANQVVLKTTVPNIPKSECYQAGTDTMEFDSGTVMREGDVIQFTLNNKVTVCKNIDMWLRISDDFLANALTMDTSADAPVALTGGTLTATATGTGEWGFIISGTNSDTPAGQVITLTLRRRNDLVAPAWPLLPLENNTITYAGGVVTDRLIVKLFDAKMFSTVSAFYKKSVASPQPNEWPTKFAGTDGLKNVLCIDTLTQNYMDEYVQNTPDSIPLNVANKLNFSGDYRIAHIMLEQTYNIFPCKGPVAGHIDMPTTTQTACVAFDFESAATGYCTDHKASRFILQTSQAYEVTDYVVTMDILVNGVAGDHGVYWSTDAVGYGAYSASASACNNAVAGTLAPSYYKADGVTEVNAAAAITACNTVEAGYKANRLVTPASSLGTVFGSSYFLYFDFPRFNWNLSEITAGDVVSVKVTLTKSTCGKVGEWTIPVGTFGCSGSACNLTFPYFTSLTAGDYWNGIAVVNTGSTAGTATFKAYEKDGSVGEVAAVAIPAKGMYVNLLEAMPWTGTGLGGQPLFIRVETNFTCDGFGMLAQPTTTGGSMGYLPRP